MKYSPGAKRGRVAKSITVISPIGGLNAQSALAEMPETDAVALDNWFPRVTDIVTRNGFVPWATGLPGPVETLMAYRTGSAQKLFAVSGGSIYDVTSQGAVGAPVVTGLSNSRWQYVNFGTIGGRFLYAVNGADYALLYDGTTWKQMNATSSPAFTGVDTRTLRVCDAANSRMWFVENASLRAWYLPLNSIAGAAQVVDLSSLAKQGGYLAGVFGWSVASLYGTQNYTVFVTSEGEIIVYQGYDPSNIATWALTSHGRIGRPVGDRFWTRIGPDVGIICADGIIPVSKAMQVDRLRDDDAISYKIVNAINTDISAYSANFGWQIQLYPLGGMLIVNVPAASGQYQYVMNTITNAWCRYTGLSANCFEVLHDSLYFGGSGVVYQAETGSSDNGYPIVSLAKQAFSSFHDPGALKMFTGARPIFAVSGSGSLTFDLNMDFEDKPPVSTPTFTIPGGPLFWPFVWGSAWGAQATVLKSYQFVSGIGYAAAAKVQATTRYAPISWQATTYTLQHGGVF